jgi:hypothetical protein
MTMKKIAIKAAKKIKPAPLKSVKPKAAGKDISTDALDAPHLAGMRHH